MSADKKFEAATHNLGTNHGTGIPGWKCVLEDDHVVCSWHDVRCIRATGGDICDCRTRAFIDALTRRNRDAEIRAEGAATVAAAVEAALAANSMGPVSSKGHVIPLVPFLQIATLVRTALVDISPHPAVARAEAAEKVIADVRAELDATSYGPNLPKLRAIVGQADAKCRCEPCPGRGNDGHGLTHCAECCFGTGVVADIDCPTHGQAAYRVGQSDTAREAETRPGPGDMADITVRARVVGVDDTGCCYVLERGGVKFTLGAVTDARQAPESGS